MHVHAVNYMQEYQLNFLDLDRTTQQTSSASSNKPNFLPRDSISGNCRRLSDVLVVTTTVGMVHRIHGHTTSARPVVTLSLELVEGAAGLEQGFVNPPTTSNNADCGPSAPSNCLFGTTWQANSSFVVFSAVPDDRRIISAGTGQRTAIARSLFDIANDGPLGKNTDRENVSYCEGSLATAVHEGTRM